MGTSHLLGAVHALVLCPARNNEYRCTGPGCLSVGDTRRMHFSYAVLIILFVLLFNPNVSMAGTDIEVGADGIAGVTGTTGNPGGPGGNGSPGQPASADRMIR